jgi:hypothetical protein
MRRKVEFNGSLTRRDCLGEGIRIGNDLVLIFDCDGV